MKCKVIFILSIILPLIVKAQSFQSGFVMEFCSGNKPLSGVEVLVMGATPAVSDVNGHFRLAFRNKMNGDLIMYDQINKNGYELVNKEDVQNWVFSTKYPVKIVMCKLGTLDESKRKYYQIGNDYYEKKYNESINNLKTQLQKNLITKLQYDKAIEEANEQLNKSKKNLEFYSNKFARINKDELYGIDKLAMQLLQEGKVDDAIKAYEDSKILDRFIEILKKRENASYNMIVMAPLLFNQVDLLIQKNDVYSHSKADTILHAIAVSDTLNSDYSYKYASFLLNEQKYSDSFHWYKASLITTTDKEKKCKILGDLNNLYLQIDNNRVVEEYKKQISDVGK